MKYQRFLYNTNRISPSTEMDLRKWPSFSLLDKEFINKIEIACVFGSTGNEALIVTKSDEVYAIGVNASGCLGFGEHVSAMQPKLVALLCGKQMKGFAFGSGPHVLAFSEKGEVFSWGNNAYCELGNGGSNHVLSPTIISSISEKRVVQVACGSFHSLALCLGGELFAWGQNGNGQIGSGQTTNHSYPRKVNAGIGGKNVVSVACGQSSSIALLDNGEVYGWGNNASGQIGIGNNSNQLSPVKVTALHGIVIKKIVCGYAHTLAISDEGLLYAWGSNNFGQLGTGNKINVNSPIRILGNAGRITDVAAIHYNSLSAAISKNFKVYMWGQCKGQTILEPFLTQFNSLHEVFLNFSYPVITYKPLRPKPSSETSVAETIKNSFDNPQCSDLTIMVQEKPIHVHKAILKLRCEYFRTMFQEHWEEDNQRVLEVDRDSYAVYRAFLQYLYTDEVDLPAEDALELLDLATEYCNEALKNRCEQIIKHGITVENAAMLYATSINLEAKELEEFCLSFALNHMTGVVQSEGFTQLNVDITKKLIVKASQRGAFKS